MLPYITLSPVIVTLHAALKVTKIYVHSTYFGSNNPQEKFAFVHNGQSNYF